LFTHLLSSIKFLDHMGAHVVRDLSVFDSINKASIKVYGIFVPV